ncbi:MAG: 4Fe-4S binding protein [Alphaproteobacteria bacterium]|nr:4Fe-4S binding protein [Alphaproteobacteria bacterium]
MSFAHVVHLVSSGLLLPTHGGSDNMAADMVMNGDDMGMENLMTLPGLPLEWSEWVFAALVAIGIYAVFAKVPPSASARHLTLSRVPGVGSVMRAMTAGPWVLVGLKSIAVAVFAMVIASGLWGTPLAERSLATTLTWTIWWTLVIISVFFVGSAWCAVCPWYTLAGWLVKGRLWRRGKGRLRLNLKMPGLLRNVWPALFMFIGLTWLELGVGVTTSPVITAALALVMVGLASGFLVLFERKGFCRYVCPVGRTIGFYSQLAPIELRAVDSDVCNRCTTLECYHGTPQIDPCPTHLTMGRFAQNTYCTSCGACVQACPYDNISWRLRPMAAEARIGARPHWDEAWFMLGLLALTSFHGVTMLPLWHQSMEVISGVLGKSVPQLAAFSIGMIVCLVVPALVFAVVVAVTLKLAAGPIAYRKLFASLAFAMLPVAFAYHLAHNLDHLVRESAGFWHVVVNPFGIGMEPMTLAERHAHMANLLLPEPVLFTFQALLMVWGFWVAAQILRHRGRGLLTEGRDLAGWGVVPMVLFAGGVTAFNTWLLMQDMIMRM